MSSSQVEEFSGTSPGSEGAGLVFAKLKVRNEAGHRSMSQLGDRYEVLSDHHKKFLCVNSIGKSLIILRRYSELYVP